MNDKSVLVFPLEKIQARLREGKYIRKARYDDEQVEAILAVISDKTRKGGNLRELVRDLLVNHNNIPQRLLFDTTEYRRVNLNLKKGAINDKYYRLVEYKRHFQLWEFEPLEE